MSPPHQPWASRSSVSAPPPDCHSSRSAMRSRWVGLPAALPLHGLARRGHGPGAPVAVGRRPGRRCRVARRRRRARAERQRGEKEPEAGHRCVPSCSMPLAPRARRRPCRRQPWGSPPDRPWRERAPRGARTVTEAGRCRKPPRRRTRRSSRVARPLVEPPAPWPSATAARGPARVNDGGRDLPPAPPPPMMGAPAETVCDGVRRCAFAVR